MDTRLDWHTGMELTPATFIESDTIEYQYKLLLRKIIASKMYGLIPDLKKEIDWLVNNDNIIIINSLKFNALTHSGEIVSVDLQQIEFAISSQQSDSLYVAIELTPETERFVQNGIEKIRQKYVLTTKTINELNERKATNVIPFGKIIFKHERYLKDEQYIPPIITIESSPDLREMIDMINSNIGDIRAHNSFSCQGNDLTIAILKDRLTSINANNTPSDYVDVCRDFVTLLSLYVFKEKILAPRFDPNDIMIWFNWFKNLTNDALSRLDSMVVNEPVPQKEEPVEDVFTPII